MLGRVRLISGTDEPKYMDKIKMRGGLCGSTGEADTSAAAGGRSAGPGVGAAPPVERPTWTHSAPRARHITTAPSCRDRPMAENNG